VIEMTHVNGATVCSVLFLKGNQRFLWIFEPSRKWKVRSEVALFALCKGLDFTWGDACEVYAMIDLAIKQAGGAI
jgi:hypothetical protein